MAKSSKTESIEIVEVNRGVIEVCLLGTTPLIHNTMSAKVRRELLLPKGRKTAAEKAGQLKHEPLEEYRASVRRMEEGPTAIGVPGPAFKGGICNAAIDVPGATKAQVGRLVHVNGYTIPVYGVPEIFSSVVRSADINKTPDVRTRAIMPQWACKLSISFIKPLVRDSVVIGLLAAAGYTQGVGDFRVQKGKGDFGQFKIVSPDDPEFVEILKTGGRKAQEKALEQPEAYDIETEELLSWFDTEVTRRGFKVAS